LERIEEARVLLQPIHNGVGRAIARTIVQPGQAILADISM
jgi:hypothetical protein